MFALFIPALIGALATAMGSLIGRAIIALGIGFVAYKGIDLGIEQLRQQVMSSITGVPGQALQLVGYLWLDKALTVVFSGIGVALSMRALGGTVKRVVVK